VLISVKIQECELAGQVVLNDLAGDSYVEPAKQASDWRIMGNVSRSILRP